MPFNRVRPRTIRLEASSLCQLRCPSCPTHSRAAHSAVGKGHLRLADFQALLRKNPRLKEIELSNYGEIFLNPELLGILEYAHQRGVALSADNGVNFNRVSEEVLEGLVKYGLRSMTVSIDGASEHTYGLYRMNGSFSAVLDNVRKLNALKDRYGSASPSLVWQFVVFGHNEHEVMQARELAQGLDMTFSPKLSWDPDFSPATNATLLRSEIGAATREEYKERFGVDYSYRICYELWNQPQINWDGRVLGCSRNFWCDMGANAFSDGLEASVNNAGLRHARQMLLGKKPAKEGVPCAGCSMYLGMTAEGKWLKLSDIRRERRRRERGWLPAWIRRSVVWRGAKLVYRMIRPGTTPRLASRVYPLPIPFPPDETRGWMPYSIFRGSTKRLPALSCHVSVLTSGTCPHAPHAHKDEEILMLLCGEVDLVLAGSSASQENERKRLLPGQFVYYPSGFAHTIRTTGGEPANYVMFKWSAGGRAPKGPRSVLGHGLFDARGVEGGGVGAGFSSRMIFKGPTGYLRKLSCHASTLAPGAGYEPHEDPYDVAVVVLEGQVETLGQRAGPHDVIFYAEGHPHGMRNRGEVAARYLVFEFHGRRSRLIR